jgi:hypothetical protein
MIGLKRVAPCAAILISSSFAAQAVAATYAFASVTGIQYGADISVTGVLVNDTAPTTITLPKAGPAASDLDSCKGFVFSMISTPRTYVLTVVTTETSDPLLGTYTILSSCGLDRTPGSQQSLP